MDQAALRLTAFAALSLVATAATNAPPLKVVFTSAPPETAFPSIWTGTNVRVDFGHSPLQRAPTIIQPPVVTNEVPLSPRTPPAPVNPSAAGVPPLRGGGLK